MEIETLARMLDERLSTVTFVVIDTNLQPV
jgi:hypothetical protein